VYKLNLSGIPRNKWLSAAGGISVAYIFIHILPELSYWHAALQSDTYDELNRYVRHPIFFFALAGLVLFYGLERAAHTSSDSMRKKPGEPRDGEGDPHNLSDGRLFWIHIGSFGVYNFIIGYLLATRSSEQYNDIFFYAIAMAFHFAVNDYALYDHYHHKYKKRGRWLLTASLGAGWLVALMTNLPEFYTSALFSFIAGGVIINVLKEELPAERKSHFPSFFITVVFYTGLLIVLG
jgi:zinc transporter ZupT